MLVFFGLPPIPLQHTWLISRGSLGLACRVLVRMALPCADEDPLPSALQSWENLFELRLLVVVVVVLLLLLLLLLLLDHRFGVDNL